MNSSRILSLAKNAAATHGAGGEILSHLIGRQSGIVVVTMLEDHGIRQPERPPILRAGLQCSAAKPPAHISIFETRSVRDLCAVRPSFSGI
jgi:hypothetical protein